MKKLLAFACIFAILSIAGCKKSEEKAATEPKASTQPQQPAKPKPGAKKRQAPPAKALEIYNEKTLVVSVPFADYASLATGKIKIGNANVSAILLKDLLAKYKIQGKNVIMGGPARAVPITWEQANTDGLYIYMTPRNIFMISAPKSLENINFPGRIVRITVSASADVAAKQTQNKKPPK